MQGLDTYDAYEKLKKSHFNETQALGIVSIVKEAIAGEVATKADFAELKGELKTDIATVRTEIETVRTEIETVRTEIRTEIGAVRTEIRTEIGAVRMEIGAVRMELAKQHTRLIVWVVSLIAIIAGAFKAVDFLF